MRGVNMIACAVVGVAAVVMGSAAARGQNTVVLETFGAGNAFGTAGTVANSAGIVNAVKISIPAGAAVNVVSVDMALAVGGAVSSGSVGIFNDMGGLPVGMPVVSAGIPGPIFGSMSYQAVPFPAGSQLNAGQAYWVGVVVTGTGSLFWGSGTMGATTTAFFNGVSWAMQTTPNPLAIRVTVAPAAGPCCNPRGTGGCAVIAAADCAAVGGVSSAAGTCMAALCATSVPGACCHGTVCFVATTAVCAASVPAGRSLGAGSACSALAPGGSNPCCPADFNGVNGLSVQDIFDFINSWLASCP
jgi:hypothetical protein